MSEVYLIISDTSFFCTLVDKKWWPSDFDVKVRYLLQKCGKTTLKLPSNVRSAKGLGLFSLSLKRFLIIFPKFVGLLLIWSFSIFHFVIARFLGGFRANELLIWLKSEKNPYYRSADKHFFLKKIIYITIQKMGVSKVCFYGNRHFYEEKMGEKEAISLET